MVVTHSKAGSGQKLKEKGDISNEVRKGTFLKSFDRPTMGRVAVTRALS